MRRNLQGRNEKNRSTKNDILPTKFDKFKQKRVKTEKNQQQIPVDDPGEMV